MAMARPWLWLWRGHGHTTLTSACDGSSHTSSLLAPPPLIAVAVGRDKLPSAVLSDAKQKPDFLLVLHGEDLLYVLYFNAAIVLCRGTNFVRNRAAVKTGISTLCLKVDTSRTFIPLERDAILYIHCSAE